MVISASKRPQILSWSHPSKSVQIRTNKITCRINCNCAPMLSVVAGPDVVAGLEMPEVFVSVHSKGHGHDEPIPPQKSSSEDSLRVHLSDEEENHLKHLLRPHCDSSDKISSLSYTSPERITSQTPPSTSYHHDPNADRIKALVGRFLKTRPPSKDIPRGGSSSTDYQQLNGSLTTSSPRLGKKKLNTPVPDDGSALTSTPPSTASSSKATKKSLAVSLWSRSRLDEPLDIKSVLAKYDLPEDVAAAVSSAVTAKQLPNKPASLDSLLSRLLLPDSGLKRDIVHAVLRRNPAAMKQSGEKLKSKLEALKQALSCSDEELLMMLGTTRNLLGLRADTIQCKLESLSNVMGQSREEIASLVRKCPHLLSCSSETLSNKFKGLQLLVQRPHNEVVSMIYETPQLLFLNPRSIDVKFAELCKMMSMSPIKMGEVVSSRPLLLTSSTTTLQERWLALQEVTNASMRWKSELLTLSPGTLASLLLASKVKVRRLGFLVSQGQQEDGALTSLLNMTQSDFLSRHPAYRKWSSST